MMAVNGNKVKVQIRGIGRYDRQGHLDRLETVEEIALPHPLNVPARLDAFRELKDGWLDGEGLAPDHDALGWLAASFDLHYPDDLPRPHVYPTVEGGVQAEWSISSNEVSLNVNLAARRGEWHSLRMDTDDEETRMLNLDGDSGWSWLAEKIRSLADIPE